MNQDYSINNKPVAQNITQAITNADVSPASKKKKKLVLKMNLILSAESLQIRIDQMKILNLKENQP